MGFFDKKSSSSSSTVNNNNQVAAPLTLGNEGDNSITTGVAGRGNTITDGGAIAGSIELAEKTLEGTISLLDRTQTQSQTTLATALNLVNPREVNEKFAELTAKELDNKKLFILLGGGAAVVGSYLYFRK